MPFKAGKYAFIAVSRMLSIRIAEFVIDGEQEFWVPSTCLTRATFNREDGIMKLTFTDGTVYQYSEVDESDFDGLKEASSKGEHFNYELRGRFPYARIG